MKTLFLTNEYPPHVYGGAGVHVDYLARELAKLMTVEVRCFGDQQSLGTNPEVRGFEVETSAYTCPKPLSPVFGALQRCLDFNTNKITADVVHCHTWYSHFGGILAKLNYGIPLVITVHSIEPLRPWKREQLGGGYDFTVWLERTALEMADAVIAVSNGTKADLERLFRIEPDRLHVIYNGIDLDEYQPTNATDALARHGIDPAQPYLLFVGRITRQKGIVHLVRAIQFMDPNFQIVLCAGAPDTPEIEAEMQAALNAAQAKRKGIIWIKEMVDKKTVQQLYAQAAVFCCPSIYEPFGIINLEAMACETAVVASAVGGIKEVVVDGETGFLVPVEQMSESPFEPTNPEKFERDLATRINQVMANPGVAEKAWTRREETGGGEVWLGRDRAGDETALRVAPEENLASTRTIFGGNLGCASPIAESKILPPVPFTIRAMDDDVVMGSLKLGHGTRVICSHYLTHHLPELYPEPECFHPERWRETKPNQYEYLPFSAGPRACIGAMFAFQVLKISLAMMLRRFRFTLVPGTRIDPTVRITMNPRNGMRMQIDPNDRQHSASLVRRRIRGMVMLP